MTESKKEWSEPELIVLVRSKPEEAVLGVCKYWLISGSIQDVASGCSQNCVGPCSVQLSS